MDGPRKVSASGLRSPGNSDPRRVASGPALQHQTSHVSDSAAVGIPVYTSIRIIQVSQIDPVLQCFKSRFDLSVHWNPSVVGDESAAHAGHVGNPARGDPSAETHFKVEVVSDAFEGKRQVLRHRMIYDALREEMNNPIHALQLKTKTPSEVG